MLIIVITEETTVDAFPRKISSSSNHNKVDNSVLRPIFRKGFPGKKSLKAEV